ncbi:MAG TPA: hypothetical protein VFA01_03465 [Candidatus Dormibacteraeota bacterium]|jgi:hypothetical protein|nr:hypothetical protein [Candidatus Dormibacteraeota bacterium]
MSAARAGKVDRKALERLVADLRVMDADGIERAAWAWDEHERGAIDDYHAAERAALAAIEDAGLGSAWDDYRRTLFGMTESRGALTHWRDQHGPAGHKAERAAFGAALGLFARDRLTRDQFVALARPMAEALPWLLPDMPPAARD